MISEEKKLALTEEIIKSKVFQKSPKSSALLRFLVKANINGSFLKEDIIDLEFFGSKSSFDKTNPRVRVNIYNLRKKLTTYYNTIGTDKDWRIFIDKGQYSVRFEKQFTSKKILSNLKPKYVFPYILLFLFGLFIFFNNLKPTAHSLWKSFFQNNKPTTLVIGDAFGIIGKTITGSSGWTRDYNINNSEDYYKLLEEKPELKSITKPATYSYITEMGAQASYDLARLFAKYNSYFDIRYSSNTSMIDLKNVNSIYVGPVRNENKFISIFNNANPYFKIEDKKVTFSGHPTLPTKFLNLSTSGKESDIAIVSRIPGPQNTTQFIFFSDHGMGVMATIEYFTNKDSLKIFEKQLKGKQNFTAIYKAIGKDRTNMDLKTLLVVPF
ncbi:helix-turn-helix domain-containing protein [Lutibacter citreus]|uniref:helix-turn-helix domain-containing protein n=1 Tax=Lutibacter citreus TaxID=2138210 RepID=UPI000DBE6774|nr:helix-turn-helix domain-containing protein [Lutibacter citreus]